MMNDMRNALIALLYFGFLLSTVAAQDLLSTADLREQIDLSSLELSPDGKHLLVLTSRQNFDSNDFTTELVMIDVETKQQHTIS